MKTKFVIITVLLLFARGCDFYSTSLWFFEENGMEGEMNPLTRIFGVGWNGLVISNILVVSGIIYLLYYFYFKYKRPENLPQQPNNYKEYASLVYFNEPNKFYQIFYKIPTRKNILLAHMGYVLAITVIIVSFIATFHNLSQYYNLSFYNRFREIVGRPLFIIYALILITFIATLRQLLISEFRKYMKAIKQQRATS